MNINEITRADHIAWCKNRALEYITAGNVREAFASMASDMKKHPETANHPALKLGLMMLMAGQLQSVTEMKRFIEGFN